jgi:hypothetical protein
LKELFMAGTIGYDRVMGKGVVSNDAVRADRTLFRHKGLTPRLAPPGVRLMRPEDVYLGPDTFGYEIGNGRGEFDPFAYTKGGLLLVEEFARLNLERETLRSRLARRSVEAWLKEHGVPGSGVGGFYGRLYELQDAQFTVREHLRVYEAISSLDAIRQPERWQPSLGFSMNQRRLVTHRMSAAHGKRRRAAARLNLARAVEELVTGLNEPETWPEIAVKLTGHGLPVAVANRRWRWTDPLTPMQFQLLEAALRLGEGRRPARRCRACHEVFLALDERRDLYCSARHRDQQLHRDHRARRRGVPE